MEELTAIEELSAQFKTNIVAISEMDWNNDMTPWKAPAVKEGEFGGHASQFLDRLKVPCRSEARRDTLSDCLLPDCSLYGQAS